MTAAVATPTSPLSGIRLSFFGLLRSEWIKLRSLRSTVWCYLLLIAATAGFGALMGLSAYAGDAPLPQAAQNAMVVNYLTVGGNFTALIAAVLGVLVISGEYTTGMIRTTYTAAPGRLSAYTAKAIILTLVTFIVALVAVAVTVAVSLPLFASNGLHVELTNPDVIAPLVGAAGFLALIALFSFGLGAILRSTAGGIAAAVGLLFVAPIGITMAYSFTQAAWASNVSTLLPGNVGSALYAYAGEGSGPVEAGIVDGVIVLDQAWSIGIFLAWVALSLIVGAILTKRRDA